MDSSQLLEGSAHTCLLSTAPVYPRGLQSSADPMRLACPDLHRAAPEQAASSWSAGDVAAI